MKITKLNKKTYLKPWYIICKSFKHRSYFECLMMKQMINNNKTTCLCCRRAVIAFN